MNGITVFIKGTPECSLLPLPSCKDTERRLHLPRTKKRVLTRRWIFRSLDLGHPAYRILRNKCLLLKPPVCGYFCYSSGQWIKSTWFYVVLTFMITYRIFFKALYFSCDEAKLFFLFFLFIFNWRIIALQYWFYFCCKKTHVPQSSLKHYL